jgi:hypothetical protein
MEKTNFITRVVNVVKIAEVLGYHFSINGLITLIGIVYADTFTN